MTRLWFVNDDLDDDSMTLAPSQWSRTSDRMRSSAVHKGQHHGPFCLKGTGRAKDVKTLRLLEKKALKPGKETTVRGKQWTVRRNTLYLNSWFIWNHTYYLKSPFTSQVFQKNIFKFELSWCSRHFGPHLQAPFHSLWSKKVGAMWWCMRGRTAAALPGLFLHHQHCLPCTGH